MTFFSISFPICFLVHNHNKCLSHNNNIDENNNGSIVKALTRSELKSDIAGPLPYGPFSQAGA